MVNIVICLVLLQVHLCSSFQRIGTIKNTIRFDRTSGNIIRNSGLQKTCDPSSTAASSTVVATVNSSKKYFRSPFRGIKEDIARRKKHYWDDWSISFRKGNKAKTFSAVLFMYFACLAPTVAFGGITTIITKGAIGVKEFLVGAGLSGMLYSIFSGQPMTIQGVTGLTLAFTSALYAFTQRTGLTFIGMYCWTGIWTSLFLALCAIFNLSDLIKYCTRFTDDCFNALISLNLFNEAIKTLTSTFALSRLGNYTSALSSLFIAFSTWTFSKTLERVRSSKFATEQVRRTISNFGPTIVILILSTICGHPTIKGLGINYLSIPESGWAIERGGFMGAIPTALMSTPLRLRLISILPASLLSLLFYLDQNISVRAVNAYGLPKGEAYHLDMLVLSGITAILSVLGMPWTCAATVTSLSHIQALGKVGDSSASTSADSDTGDDSSGEMGPDDNDSEATLVPVGSSTGVVLTDVIETRLSNFCIHFLLMSSVFAIPLLSRIPVPVISGLFFYLGRKIMKGNLYFDRMAEAFCEKKLLGPNSIYSQIPTRSVGLFLGIQTFMLSLIWTLQRYPSLSLLFPSCIGALMLVRVGILPKLFDEKELTPLDPDT